MSSPPSEPTLLSGDKHLLVQHRTGCEIWDFADGRRIWARDDIRHTQVVAQPVHDGTSILITLCTRQALIFTLDPALMDCKLLVEVSILDLGTNSERSMPSIQLPPMFLDFSDPVIADGMWAANVAWLVRKADVVRYRGVLLVNWKERTFVLLDCPVELVHKRSPKVAQLPTWSFTHLPPSIHTGSRSTPPRSPEKQSPIRIEPIILTQTVYPVLQGRRTTLTSVHDCPLHHGSYVVTTHTASVRRLPAGSAESRQPAFHRFRLTLLTSASEPQIWEPISGGGTVDCVLIDSFTSPGASVVQLHAQEWGRGVLLPVGVRLVIISRIRTLLTPPVLAECTVAAPSLHPTACGAVSASASPRLHPQFAVPGLNSRNSNGPAYIRFHILPFSLISGLQSTRSSIKPLVSSRLPSDFVPLVCAKIEVNISDFVPLVCAKTEFLSYSSRAFQSSQLNILSSTNFAHYCPLI
ncbi:hypothetical protein DFH09DRAFT_1088953 [Mycena vulgaris]|nr:hypothetical protein DFH09DRAFT_1088953 [Mycena vulgaris]